MSLFSPLLVIAFDEERAKKAASLAASLGYPDAHIVAGGFAEAIKTLRLRATSPDYIVIDIGQHPHAGLMSEIDDFAHYCEPKVRVVAVGGEKNPELHRTLRERGVLEYFSEPLQQDDIRRVLIMGGSHFREASKDAPHGMVISCMSAHSGDGASSVAINLAACLAAESGKKVVLVDMDYQFGLISKSLELAAPFGIRELFDNPGRGLDEVLVGKMLVEYKPGLSIIAAPGDLHLLPIIRPELIRELIGILRSRFDYVVLDIPHLWTEWTASALSYSNVCLMVAQLWLRSLTHASRLLAAWHAVGISGEVVLQVINRHGAKFKEAISAEDFERICRRPIDAYLSNDIKAVTHAENNAQTLFETEISSPVREELRSLARKLMAKSRVSTAQPKGKSDEMPKKSLLSFRFKK